MTDTNSSDDDASGRDLHGERNSRGNDANGGARRTPLDIARDALRRGFTPVPIKQGKKSPTINDWPNLVVTEENIERLFGRANLNVGVIMGPKSSGLADIDLDCEEAVKLAEYFAPETHSVYGRAGKKRSHWLYTCADPDEKAVIKLKDENGRNGKVIVELRLGGGGKGCQSVLPGSIHTSGEIYEWDEDGERGSYPCSVLKTANMKIAVATLLVRNWPEGGRHDACMIVGGFLARIGWEKEDIKEFLVAVQKVAGVTDPEHVAGGCEAAMYVADDPHYGYPALEEQFGEAVAKKIAKFVEFSGDAPEPTSQDGRPTIRVEGGMLSKMADDGEAALIAANVQFYERANILVRPIVKDVDAFHGRKTKAAQLVRVEPAYMRDALCQKANWVKKDMRARRWNAVDPPHEVASTILTRSGDWRFPTIAGVITTQTMRPDGTILYQPGYDPATRLLLVDPPEMPPVLEEPTKDDAVRSLELLEDLLKEFPLVGDVDRAVALSALITPVVRGAFPVSPMHVADAPVPGSGKSYLFDTAAVIATGQVMPVIAAGANNEELEKRLGATLLAGQSLITIDNVTGELGGAALYQIIERPRPEVRILGRSEMVAVDAGGTTLFANGNNITIAGELCRRTIRTTLDPNMERPELRVFAGDPVRDVLANRGVYVAAALTICRAYITAGRPNPVKPLASFDGWSNTVASALAWLGKADCISSVEINRAEDPDSQAISAMLLAWAKANGTGLTHKLPLKEVIEKVKLTTPGANENTFTYPELHAAVHSITPARVTPDVNTLGYWLRSNHRWDEVREAY